MRKILAVLLLALLSLDAPVWAGGLGGHKTMYIGGTVDSLKAGVEGKSSTADTKVFVFEFKGGRFVVPYDRVDSLEYGQKAGRRIGLAIVINPVLFFSKKRKHFLTLGYTDENDKQQAAVFELGKDIVRVMLASLEARTGRKIEYQDEEARKNGVGN